MVAFFQMNCSHEDKYDETMIVYLDYSFVERVRTKSCCILNPSSIKLEWYFPSFISDIPINGAWSNWEAWSVCSSECRRNRTRACDDPVPQYAGLECPEHSYGLTYFFRNSKYTAYFRGG